MMSHGENQSTSSKLNKSTLITTFLFKPIGRGNIEREVGNRQRVGLESNPDDWRKPMEAKTPIMPAQDVEQDRLITGDIFPNLLND